MEQGDRVLIIEDDPDIAEVVAVNLADIGLRTERAADGRTGLEGARRRLGADHPRPDAPRLDGLAVCARIREKDPFPLMMLTARSEEADRVAGLEIGADEYVTKPFSVRELSARVKALLRRVHADRDAAAEGPRVAGSRPRARDGPRHAAGDSPRRQVELTVKEFDLLALFARNPGGPTAARSCSTWSGATSTRATSTR